MNPPSVKTSGLICVSKEDIPYLFEYSLVSSLEKINFIDSINVVTPNPKLIKDKISGIRIALKTVVNIIPDSELLTSDEMELCGWSKQQIIKLRSYKLIGSENILNIGADTVTLDKLAFSEFYSPDKLIVNYRKHNDFDKHYKFEIERVNNIYNLLGLSNISDRKTRDYIFDVFLFKKYVLKEFEDFLLKKYGHNYFAKIFPAVVNGYEDMVKTGEWSLYTIFAIEILALKYKFQDGTKIVHQIHSHKELATYDYSDKVVHFVRKDFDKSLIFPNIKKHISYYEGINY